MFRKNDGRDISANKKLSLFVKAMELGGQCQKNAPGIVYGRETDTR